MRIVVVLVVRAPEERPDDRRRLDGAKGQLERPDHGHVLVLGQRDCPRHEGVLVLGVFLDAVAFVQC